MKTIHTIVMMLAMMVAALGITACGDDDDEIDNGSGESVEGIEGTWAGDMRKTFLVQMYDGKGSVINDGKGSFIDEMIITFDRGGSGYSLCYIIDPPFYVVSRINWKVNNDILQIYTVGYDDIIEIQEYELSESKKYLYGWLFLNGALCQDYKFRFQRTATPDYSKYLGSN